MFEPELRVALPKLGVTLCSTHANELSVAYLKNVRRHTKSKAKQTSVSKGVGPSIPH